MTTYLEKLQNRIEQARSHLCVGLDPRAETCDTELKEFLFRAVDETGPYAAAFKPNLAYYEAFGSSGLKLFEEVRDRIPTDIPVILDAKRSDIGETQRYYAKAMFETWGGDAVTLNPLMGFDSIEPFLHDASKAVYLLGVTSNPGAADFLLRPVNGRYFFEELADWKSRAAHLPGSLGLVAGLTNLSPEIQARLPDWPILAPGFGAQGGAAEALRDPRRKSPDLINVSRGILYADTGETLAEKAARYREKIEAALSI